MFHFGLEVAPLIQSGVQHRTGVALGQDQTVPVSPLRILWIKVHLLKIEGSDNIRDRQSGTGMTILSLIDHPHCFQAKLLSDFMDLLIGHIRSLLLNYFDFC